jgi:catechol 2,3-dioxygenase-like lactoylglutathione lyase family enzyme
MSTIISPTRTQPSFRRLSSVLLVDRIEPCLEFWVDRLGFEVRLKIDGEDHAEFVALGHGEAEIMYRTRDSVNQETPGLVDGIGHQPWVVIYLEVDDLDDILPKLDGIEVVVPLRETILGTREIFFREPSGRILALTSRN